MNISKQLFVTGMLESRCCDGVRSVWTYLLLYGVYSRTCVMSDVQNEDIKSNKNLQILADHINLVQKDVVIHVIHFCEN